MTIIGRRILRQSLSASILPPTCAVRCNSTFSYVAVGEDLVSEKPPLVILHGALGSGTNWKSLSHRISAVTKSPVYALDAPNHGECTWTDTMSYESMAESVADFAKEKSLQKVHLLGHSMGGKIVMVAALKFPELVEKLVVVDAAPCYSVGAGAVTGYVQAMKDLDLSSISRRSQVAPALESSIAERGIREFIAMNATVDPDTKTLRWRCNVDAIEQFLPEMAKFPHFGHAANNVETLFIGGTESPYITTQQHPEIRRLFPNAEIKMIAGGHWIHYDNPSEFLETTASFLKAAPGETAV